MATEVGFQTQVSTITTLQRLEHNLSVYVVGFKVSRKGFVQVWVVLKPRLFFVGEYSLLL